MEMVHRLDNENLIDNDGRRILMDNLTGYKNELYRDPLTGVYNRRYYEDNIKDLNEQDLQDVTSQAWYWRILMG